MNEKLQMTVKYSISKTLRNNYTEKDKIITSPFSTLNSSLNFKFTLI